MRRADADRISEFELRLMSVALVHSARLAFQRLDQQLRESRVISVAGGTIPICQHPVRMLRQQSIVHFALKLRVSGNVDSHKARRSFQARQTFWRWFNGLKMRFHPGSKLKTDILRTSIGSCRRRRSCRNFFQFGCRFTLRGLRLLTFIVLIVRVSGRR